MSEFWAWVDGLSELQLLAALGLGWLAVAVGLGVVGGKLMAMGDEECDDECSLRIMRTGECRHDERRREVRRG